MARPPAKPIHRAQPPPPTLLQRVIALFRKKPPKAGEADAKPAAPAPSAAADEHVPVHHEPKPRKAAKAAREEPPGMTSVNPANVIIMTVASVLIVLLLYGVLNLFRGEGG